MIFSREGTRALRFSFAIALTGVAVAVFLVAGSYYYWQVEKKGDQQSQRMLRDLRGRLDTIRRERDDLRNSADVYKTLSARGVFMPEQRLDLVEAFAELRNRHRLIGLEYEVSPQRALHMASGITFPGVDVMGSRIKLKVQTYHDGDLIAFLDEFPRMQRGFFPIDRCVIKRTAESAQRFENAGSTRSAQPAGAGDPAEAAPIAAGLEAECFLDWVTLVDKRNPAPVIAVGSQKNPS